MTNRELRTRRRAEERRQKKNDRHSNPPATPRVESSVSPEILAEFGPELIAQADAMRDRVHRTGALRADINRANAALSTGPKTSAGKARSSRNAFRHGLYSKDLIVPGENPAEFDELRATLRREHQPANTTEEILVDELAQSFWRMRRFRHLEAVAWDPDKLSERIDNGLMTLVQRAANSAERSFHKTLASLAKLQKERGFVPQKIVAEQPAAEETGFVPQKTAAELEPGLPCLFSNKTPPSCVSPQGHIWRQQPLTSARFTNSSPENATQSAN